MVTLHYKFYFSFLSSLLTAVMTYHVAWVTTVTPSSDVARRAYLDKHSSESVSCVDIFEYNIVDAKVCLINL